MVQNPYEKYRQQSVMTMTQGEMLIKLYDGTTKQLSIAIAAMDEGDIEKSNVALQKAQKIVNYLNATLNYKYEISGNLSALYVYFIQMMVRANIKKNTAPILEILPMIEELRDVYSQADHSVRSGMR